MKFIVVTNEWMSAHGLTPLPTMRKSKDGSKIILHEDYFNLIAKRDEEDNLLLEGAEVYTHNSVELNNLLASNEWSWSEEEAPTESADFIQVAAVRNLMTTTKAGIQTMALTDEEALKVKDMYPEWSEFINQSLTQGTKVQHGNKLYKVLQDVNPVLEIYPPGAVGTEALYTIIDEDHAGTLEDPIPYPADGNMIIYNGKYYIENDIIYLCIRDSQQPLYVALSTMVDNYVQVVEQ